MINYQRLVIASKIYDAYFKQIDTPTIIESWIDDLTRPPSKAPFVVDSTLRLAASGEQGFLQLRAQGLLPDGTYQTISPCFRKDIVDELHQHQFVKLELIEIATSIKPDFVELQIQRMMLVSKMFFESQGITSNIIETGPKQYDLICSKTGIELGSYGFRTNEDLGDWIYGTGCAEPRMDIVLQKIKDM